MIKYIQFSLTIVITDCNIDRLVNDFYAISFIELYHFHFCSIVSVLQCGEKRVQNKKKKIERDHEKNRINNTTLFNWTFNYLYTSHLVIYNNAFVQYFATCMYGLVVVYSKVLYDFVFQKSNTNTDTHTQNIT